MRRADIVIVSPGTKVWVKGPFDIYPKEEGKTALDLRGLDLDAWELTKKHESIFSKILNCPAVLKMRGA